MGLAELFRFRRSLLEEEHGEENVGGHFEELALPVLQGRLEEVVAQQVSWIAQGCLAVLLLLLPEATVACDTHRNEGSEEHQGENDRESVLLQDSPGHCSAAASRGCFGITRPSNGRCHAHDMIGASTKDPLS